MLYAGRAERRESYQLFGTPLLCDLALEFLQLALKWFEHAHLVIAFLTLSSTHLPDKTRELANPDTSWKGVKQRVSPMIQK